MNDLFTNQYLADNQEKLLIKAFELAFFIHPNKNIAVEITSNAFEMWEVLCERQDKRRYYNLKGRLLGNQEIKKQRVKVYMQKEQLLQRLIYNLSEEYELTSSWCKSIDEEGLLICYLKHLLSIILKHNSFSVVVGISRVLHRYSNRETVELYMSLASNRATQDFVNIERESKRHKGKIIDQLKETFADFITCSKSENEERFEPIKDHNKFSFLFRIVEDCLERFKPWATECVKSFNDFTFNDNNPDNEYPVELKRIHSVIHYDCYKQLTASLNLANPKERLEIPLFSLVENQNDKNNTNRRNPPNAIAELKNIPEKLKEVAKRRKKVLAGTLSIIVDRKEKTTFNTITDTYKNFYIEENAEIIEIRNKKDGLLLATHLIMEQEFGDTKKEQNYQIKLEGGQVIKLKISYPENVQTDKGKTLCVGLWYKETHLLRRLRLIVNKLVYKITDPNQNPKILHSFSSLQVAITIAIITITTLLLYFYFNSSKTLLKQEPLTTKEEKNTPKPTISPKELPFSSPSPNPERKEIVKQKNTPKNPKQNNQTLLPTIPPDFSERSGDTVKTLSSIRKIYVKLQNESFQKDIEVFIKANSLIKIVDYITEADAVLQYSSSKKAFLLVNRNNYTLWQKKVVINNNTSKEVIENATSDLLKKIGKSQE